MKNGEINENLGGGRGNSNQPKEFKNLSYA